MTSRRAITVFVLTEQGWKITYYPDYLAYGATAERLIEIMEQVHAGHAWTYYMEPEAMRADEV